MRMAQWITIVFVALLIVNPSFRETITDMAGISSAGNGSLASTDHNTVEDVTLHIESTGDPSEEMDLKMIITSDNGVDPSEEMDLKMIIPSDRGFNPSMMVVSYDTDVYESVTVSPGDRIEVITPDHPEYYTLTGVMDDMMIWNRTLTIEEIEQLALTIPEFEILLDVLDVEMGDTLSTASLNLEDI